MDKFARCQLDGGLRQAVRATVVFDQKAEVSTVPL